ncbi:TIGR00282 family metallophosphoesterase [Candidatus Babeliales bacterium]|nr:TIGR00282 family metallophosphoesterase [Candidatus Babeliales bacterium]
MKKGLRILFIGDIVGPLGVGIFQKHIDAVKKQCDIDAVVVNGENAATDGRGIVPRIAASLKHNGANVITTGNHVWARREIYQYLSENNDVLRPANFPSGCPGTGVTTITVQGHTVGIMNLQGRVFMNQHVDCPFKAADSLLTYLNSKTKCIFIDFHAETTSEKIGLGHYMDGRVTGVVGTHTHVQTADERILPGGTAFVTDLGMTGALDSMLGMKTSSIMPHLLTQMPNRFMVEDAGPAILSGVWIEFDPMTGKALNIERVLVKDTEFSLNS